MESWFGCFNGYGMGGGYWMMFLGFVIIGMIIYFLVKGQNQNRNVINNNEIPSPNAIEIANTRLARGEITSEEYENIKKNLL